MAVNCIFIKDGLCNHGNLRDASTKIYCSDADTVAFNACKVRVKRPRKKVVKK